MAEDDMMEFIHPDTIAMTIGKQYRVWCQNDMYVVVSDDLCQWRMFPYSWFDRVPMLTDSGALEYEEIMESIGGITI